MIRLVRVVNPFLPSEGKTDRLIEHVPLQPLEAYLLGESVEACTLSVNGCVWARDRWHEITPVDGDCIVIAPIIEGGGLWRTLASVAVIGASIAAYFFLGPLGPLANTTAAMIAGAISAVGSTLVNIFMGPAPPSSKAETPSYAFSGPTTLAHAGSPIPKQYGRFLGGGCVIEQFTDIEGANQYISALVCYGFGPALSLNALQLNGKDVSLYQNVDYYFRTGLNNQQPIPGFGRIVNGYAQDTKCLSGQPVVVPGTGTQTQALQVDVQFPEGVFRTDSSGNIKSLWITYLVEYSVSGQNIWQPVIQPRTTHDLITYNSNGTLSFPYWSAVATDLPAGSGVVYSTDSDSGAHYIGEPWNETQTVTVYAANGSDSSYSRVFHGEWMKTDPTLNQVVVDDWTAGYVDYVDNRTSVLYNRTSIYGLAPNKYDVRITKYGSGPRGDTVVPGDNENPRTGEQIWVHNVNEIAYRTLSYPNMVLVGVRALATNQLSGGNPQVLADISMGLSMPMPSELATFPLDNPACVATDMMTSPVYGGGADISLANIVPYIDQWVSWAQLNETLVPDGSGNSIRLHPFNGIFDTDESLWAQISKVGQMSRAAILQIGVNYGVFIDQPEDPVQMFSMGNIVKDSFQESWLALDDRATQVDVEFADFTRSYRTDSPVTAIDPADIDNGIVLKPTRIKLIGCTVPGQAWHNANFRLQTAKSVILTGQFTTAMAGIACRAGNVVLLQHDVPSWGWGGRTLPGSTTTRLVIDRSDLTWGNSGAYNMLVLQPSVERYTGTVQSTTVSSASGAPVCTLTLSSFDATRRVTRILVAGKDMAISGSGTGVVTVDGTAGVLGSVGATYALYDTDVIDTQAVANVQGDIVTLATPLQSNPGPFATYIYGPAGAEAQKVRVTSIRRTDETHAQIEWAQYALPPYTFGTPVIGATLVASAISAQVSDLALVESHVAQNGATATYAVLSWKNGSTTVGVDIYGSVDGSQQRYLARVSGGATIWQTVVSTADSWIFRVVGFDAYDDFAPMNSAPTVSILVVGPTGNLLLGTDFASGFSYWATQPSGYTAAGFAYGIPGVVITTSADNGGEAVCIFEQALSSAPGQPGGLGGDQNPGSPVFTNVLWQMIPPQFLVPGQWLQPSAYLSTSAGVTGEAGVFLYPETLTPPTSADYPESFVSYIIPPNGIKNVRVWGPPIQVPPGVTAASFAWTLKGLGTLGTTNVPAGSTFTLSYPQVEVIAMTPVTLNDPGLVRPSAYQATDVVSLARSLIVQGSSSALRAQASLVPGYTPAFNVSTTPTTVTASWTALSVMWRDGTSTAIPDGQLTFSGLTPLTTFTGFLYFDLVRAQITPSTLGADSGSPPQIFSAYSAQADASCYLDTRVPMTPGGLQMTTQAAPPTAPILTGLTVSPSSASMLAGTSQQLAVTGSYSNGTTADVTSASSFISSNGSVASVSAGGLVTAQGGGGATITAAYASFSATASISVTVTVAPPTLSSINITPSNVAINVGAGVQLTVTAYYSDGSSADVTGSSSYSSSNPGAATVSSGGYVSGVASGAAGINAAFQGAAASDVVTVVAVVSSPTLTGISTVPTAVDNVTPAFTYQITVTGNYSDGSTANLTSSSSYVSGDNSVATVSGTGLITAQAPGSTTVTASCAGFSAGIPVSVVASSPPIQRLIGYSIAPTTAALNGTSQQLTATGSYSDGTTSNLTPSSTYASSNTSITAVSAGGLITPVSAGSATVTASYYGGFSATCAVTVTIPGSVAGPTLSSITVSPTDQDVNVGGAGQLTVTAHFSDGSSQNVTTSSSTSYSSNDTSIVTVNGVGRLRGENAGSATVTAVYGGLTGSASVDVNPKPGSGGSIAGRPV